MKYVAPTRIIPNSYAGNRRPFFYPSQQSVPISSQENTGLSADSSLQFFITFHMILANLRRNRATGKRPPAPSNIREVQQRFSCDFEVGWCPGWARNDSKELDWEVHSGPTTNPYTGPDIDHTLKSADGHYAFFNGSVGYYGEHASFFTPYVSMENSLQYCLKFWYHMRGRGFGTLKVFWKFPATKENRTGFEYLIFSKKRPDSLTEFDWKQAKITLYSPLAFTYISPVNFEFQVSKGIFRSSDVALDDISLTPGACYQTTSRPTIPNEINPNFYNGSAPESDRFTPSDFAPTRVFNRCGSSSLYNPQTHTCCNGKVSEGKGRCCGTWVMVHPNQECCDNTHAYYPGKQQCCNGRIYLTLFHQCCNGELLLRRHRCNN